MSIGFTIEKNNVFNAIFAPIAKKFALSLHKRGVHVFFADQNISQSLPRLVFGAHSNPKFWIENKKEEDIFVNFEPIFNKNWQNNNFQYIEMLNTSRVFDYSIRSQDLLKKSEFLPLPPLHSSNERVSKQVDVLFVGSINERRKLIFEKLIDNGIILSCKFKIFGEELFKEIERAKVFLDTNIDKNYIFNIYRFCLCADTDTIYVGEAGDTSDYPEIKELLGLTIINNTDELINTVKKLSSDQNYRENLLKTQKNIAKNLEKKFQIFVDSFSQEFH